MDFLIRYQVETAIFGLLFLIATVPIWNKTYDWKKLLEKDENG